MLKILIIAVLCTCLYIFITILKFRPVYIPLKKPEIFKNKVIVSTSTIPSRTPNLQRFLTDLESQTQHPDIVYINIPYYSKREKCPYVIPTLTSKLNVIIQRCTDHGPLTKLLPVATSNDLDPNDIIITLDDDQQYDPNLIKNMVDAMQTFPANCITFAGWNYLKIPIVNLMVYTYLIRNSYVDALEGFSGTGYRRRFFSEDFGDYKKCKSCFTVDDVYISMYLTRKKVRIISLKYKDNDGKSTIKDCRLSNPLCDINILGSACRDGILEMEEME